MSATVTIMNNLHSYGIWTLLLLSCGAAAHGQSADSTGLMNRVRVHGQRQRTLFSLESPAQALDRRALQQLNVLSVGDAARYFSGVLVKDYGGVGGLKTISVRSLGASSTGILYDGIPVSDVQTGQVDLSHYSNTFLQSIDLYQGQPAGSLLPARAYASASLLAIRTMETEADDNGLKDARARDQQTGDHETDQQAEHEADHNNHRKSVQASIQTGSFGLLQSALGARFNLPRHLILSVTADGLHSNGNYPYRIVNGRQTEHRTRNNAATGSLQSEINLSKQFADHSSVEFKTWGYASDRDLPGSIIFFNDHSEQSLRNRIFFTQARYRRLLGSSTAMSISAKWNHDYTHYRDPSFLNNAGGLDQQYTQHELYGSATIDHRFTKALLISVAGDVSHATLNSNTTNFDKPSRLSTWSNLALRYDDSTWQVNASTLWTHVHDHLPSGGASDHRDEVSPGIAVSRRLNTDGHFKARASYKHVFRMPTFNDLYYHFIGNVDLRPELSRQFNAGLVYQESFTGLVRHAEISVDGYYNRIHDKIVAVPGQNLFAWTMLNLGTVRIIGVDVTAALAGRFSEATTWNARINYTWQQAQDLTDARSSRYKDRIPYTPDHSGSALLAITYRQWTSGSSMLFSGTRYTLGENSPTNQLDGWATFDVFLARGFNWRSIHLNARAELDNLADQRYEVVRYYPMPGRSFKLSFLFNNL